MALGGDLMDESGWLGEEVGEERLKSSSQLLESDLEEGEPLERGMPGSYVAQHDNIEMDMTRKHVANI